MDRWSIIGLIVGSWASTVVGIFLLKLWIETAGWRAELRKAKRDSRIAEALASIDYRKNLEGWKETRT